MDDDHQRPVDRHLRRELRGVLNRMRMDRIKQQETEAVAALRTDPTAAQRLRAAQPAWAARSAAASWSALGIQRTRPLLSTVQRRLSVQELHCSRA